MATIETVNFGPFGTMVQANISTIVGEGQINDRNDVLLIQTLFRMIGDGEVFTRALFGLEPHELPEPNGVFEKKTIRAIWGFQRQRRHRLMNVEGKIHPARYRDRVLKKGPQARHMMITLLNLNAAQVGEHPDLISAIRKISPSIIFN